MLSFPIYYPTSYDVQFPFFESNGDSYLPLLGRDDVVCSINNITLPDPNNRLSRRQKYWPIIISTSRGMGKTFLLKMIGMQKVKEELQNVLIQEALSCGRIISFDFAKNATAIQSLDDVKSFFPRLMIYFLCLLFDGTQVDGINFEAIEFDLIPVYGGIHPELNVWLKTCLNYRSDRMMDEYIRLTNIAFSVPSHTNRSKAPPVFLLDEIQTICHSTSIRSKRNSDGSDKMHTFLSLLLTQLAGKHNPICICTGTNDGDIIAITEISVIIPQVLSLTPLAAK